MLHLIFQTTVDAALLQRFGAGDAVVFFEGAVFCLTQKNRLQAALSHLPQQGVQVYALLPELQIRGLQANELQASVQIIAYSDLVQLTEQHKVIATWR